MTVNEKIAELLDWRGVSQLELSNRTGIPHSTINAYITGRTPISLDVANKIATALGVTRWAVLNCEPLLADTLDMTSEEAELVITLRGLTCHQRELIFKGVELMKKQNAES